MTKGVDRNSIVDQTSFYGFSNVRQDSTIYGRRLGHARARELIILNSEFLLFTCKYRYIMPVCNGNHHSSNTNEINFCLTCRGRKIHMTIPRNVACGNSSEL